MSVEVREGGRVGGWWVISTPFMSPPPRLPHSTAHRVPPPTPPSGRLAVWRRRDMRSCDIMTAFCRTTHGPASRTFAQVFPRPASNGLAMQWRRVRTRLVRYESVAWDMGHRWGAMPRLKGHWSVRRDAQGSLLLPSYDCRNDVGGGRGLLLR